LWGELKKSEEVDEHTKRRKLGVRGFFSPGKKLFWWGELQLPQLPPLYPSLNADQLQTSNQMNLK